MNKVNYRSIITVVAFSLILITIVTFTSYARSYIELRIHTISPAQLDTPAEILLIDPQGRKTGFDASAPFDPKEFLNLVEEIPDSIYGQEGIGATSEESPIDDSGIPSSRGLTVYNPLTGKHLIQIIGKSTGSYLLEGYFGDTSGKHQTQKLRGFTLPGQTATTDIDYSPVPGVPIKVVKKVTIPLFREEIQIARQLNEIDNDGIANSLLKKLDAVESSLNRGNKKTAENQLNALVNEVNAQSDKHIKPQTSDILVADANLLIANLDNPSLILPGGPQPSPESKFQIPPVDSTFRLREVYSYPNPAVGGKKPTIHVECGIADSVEIRIYNTAGELVHETKLTKQPEIIDNQYAYEYNWNTSGVASGVYLYVVVAKKSGEKDIKVTKKLAVVK